MKNILLLFSLISAPFFLISQEIETTPLACKDLKKNHAHSFTTASDPRSDSIDLKHCELILRLEEKPQIYGICRYEFDVLISGVWGVYFDLEELDVSLVNFENELIEYNQDSTGVQVIFPSPLTPGNYDLTLFYQGTPKMDASGWGGVYAQGNYFYNLGVGFDSDPHNYGRVWLPCFDNFHERHTLQLRTNSLIEDRVFGNGVRTEETVDSSQQLRFTQWEMNDPIPSYLMCFAAGPFADFERTYAGETGNVPVQIAVAPGDSVQLAGSFQHLEDAFSCFEYWYGPYQWDKIGYSIVPFNSGAMEHATNIAYMNPAVDGTTNFEDLMAHELSHHWWGDLATCSTAEDMWLNEGWASFSEYLFFEWVYGKESYTDAVWSDFLLFIQTAHVSEGGYRAISGLPHSLTYGSHVYDKGALMVHNLRTYMGDSLFRVAMRQSLSDFSMTDWSSEVFRDKISQESGLDMTAFFDDWVFQPGFSHFQVDSFTTEANDQLHIYFTQKLRGADHFHTEVPLEITLIDNSGNRHLREVMVSGEKDDQMVSLNGIGAVSDIWINPNRKLTLAQTADVRTIKTTGTQSFSNSKMNVQVQAVPDSFEMRVEYHYAMPDSAAQANPHNYVLTNRYWTIQANIPDSFEGRASIFFDGKGQLDILDAELFAQTSPSEDSILLLYRPGPGYPWLEHPDYFLNFLGSKFDKYGGIRIDKLYPGEYTIGKGISGMVSAPDPAMEPKIKAYPNPTSDELIVESTLPIYAYVLTDMMGKVVVERIGNKSMKERISIKSLPAGTYQLMLQFEKGGKQITIEKL